MSTAITSAVERHDHRPVATHSNTVDRPTADPSVDISVDMPVDTVVDITVDIIDAIIVQHRRRRFFMAQRIRAINALGAYLRFDVLGWSRALPASTRDRIKAQAKAIIKTCAAHIKRHSRSDPFPDIPGVDAEEIELVLLTLGAQLPFVDSEERAKAEMERLAQQLPVWPRVAGISGFSALGLAVIVGEAGRDLAAGFRSPAALWKRMGVAIINNPDGSRIRQGGLSKNAPKAEWIRHGYDRRRRSRVYVIGEGLIKNNGSGKYKALYDRRKALEIAKAEAKGLKVVPAAQIPARRRSEFMSRMQVHRRAQRVMEKELLKDLWIAWRRVRTISDVQPRPRLSAASTRSGRPVLLPVALRRPVRS
jgi:hypothetical protein